MRKPSPLVQMTLALVGLCGTLVLLADLFFGVVPDRHAQARDLRQQVAESLAVQVAALLQADDPATLERTLDSVAERTAGVQSLAIRLGDGSLLAEAGDHARHWQAGASDRSDAEQVTVPLNASGTRWGSVEVAFAGDGRGLFMRWLSEPLVVLLLFMSAAGTLAFGLYMRRALQHLDPSSVIPERVQVAFDAMAEGVVALDGRGRILLANRSFRELHPQATEVAIGKALSALPWLAPALSANAGDHPWTHSMSERAASSGHTLEVDRGTPHARKLVINCAPISDPGGSVRGCLVTFNDVTQLHRANEALQSALAALTASKEEVERQNVQLERLATRDPLTGCLNRRAFHEAFEARLHEARTTNGLLSCVMLDIDHFKRVNDTHGHGIGDRVIQEVAKKVLDCTRSADLVCRYGGEEFCVVLPGLGLADAAAFAERVRERVDAECGPGVREVDGLQVTVSLGVEALSREIAAAPALIDRADHALYRAKRGGRNRVCTFEPGDERAAALKDGDPLVAFMAPSVFDHALSVLLRDGRVRSGTLSAVQLAVDPYRALLATAGADVAEHAARDVARVLRRCARPGDLLARLDAEHFAVVSPGLGPQDALAFAEKVRAQVESEGHRMGETAAGTAGAALPPLTVTLGLDTLPGNALGTSTLIQRAGKALLRARRGGGNCVARFSAGTEAGPGSPAPAAAEASLP